MILKIKFLNILFCFAITLNLSLYAQNDELRFKHITSEQGLLANRTTAVLQDSKGVLWVGNKIGINRYDSEISKVYYVGQNNNINQFLEYENKNILVATENGLYFFDRKKDNFIQVKSKSAQINKLLLTNVLSIVSTQENEFLIGGHKEFLVKLKIDPKGNCIENATKIFKCPLGSGNITKIVKESNDSYWLGTDSGRILHFHEKIVEELNLATSGNNVYVNDMAKDNWGNLWIATNGNGLYSYDVKKGLVKHFYKNGIANGQTINNNVITRIYTEGNKVWIGTDGGGLNLYSQDKKYFNYYMYNFGNEFSISDNSIIAIQPGLNEAILLGTVHGGISIFKNNNEIKNIPAANFKFLIQDPQGSRVLEDSYKNIWISTGRTGLRRYNPRTKALNVYTTTSGDNAYKGEIILSLFEDKNKRLWAGTLREGVNVFDLVKNQFINLPNARNLKGVFAVAEDAFYNIWVGHGNGICIYNKDLRLINTIPLVSNPLSNSNQVICLYKDVAGAMWVGTTNGLFKFEYHGKTLIKTIYKHDDKDANSLSSSNILSIGETGDFSILVGTYGYGVNKFVRETGKFVKIVNSDKIKGGIIRGILKDNQKNIWLSTNVGLSKIDPKNNVTNFGISDGVFPFNGGSASLNSDGTILMAGVYGLSTFNPAKLRFKNYFPEVYFSSVNSVTEKNEALYSFSKFANDTVVIESGSKLINVNFSSSELYSKNSIKYQFLMVGLNDNWQNLGSQNKISFSNLDPGNYLLKVRATNNSQFWNAKYSTLNIIVEPTFWQRPFVKFLLFLGFVYMLVYLYRWRMSSIKNQKEKLQKLLDHKTIEVKQQEQKISQDKISFLEVERQNQILKQKKLEDELNFKIAELTNNTLRAMHKNNLLTDIKEKLKTEIKNKIIDKKSLEGIVSHINDSFILDADWESFYTLFNQVHPMFIKSLKNQYATLGEREIRLCALILIDFSSQHIATLFGISLTSVKVARHRLRKKLNIPNDKSVKDFLLSIKID